MGGADEARGERGLRAGVEVLGAADLLDAPAAQQHHAIGHRHRLGLVVGHVHHRDAEALLEGANLAAHLAAQLRVEVGKRLVHEAHRRLGDDRAAECHALLLASGELGGLAREEVLEPEESGDPRESRLAVGHLAHAQSEHDVLRDVEVREERIGLEHHRDAALRGRKRCHVAPADANGSRARGVEAGDEAKRRRLAASRGTQQHDERPGLGGERDAIEGARCAPVLGDTFELDGGHRGPRAIFS